jgi:putative glycosyltransferase (TIGR04372 family)
MHLSFTPEEERLGLAALRELGIPDDTPFVWFHARDSTYLNAVHPKPNWHYHDYRDSSIHNYVPAAEELTRRGYFAVRMGGIVREALTTTNPMIIDCAMKSRNDFLDIFLGAKCRFALGCPSGITGISMIFRRPVAWVNFIPLGYAPTWGPNDLFIPKKLWLREECRFLTFREILDSGIGWFWKSEQYEQLGIEVMENTPKEITALAVEMDERLKGTWQTTEEDDELQRNFWSLFKPSELHGIIVSRIGAEFLRQNRELLD